MQTTFSVSTLQDDYINFLHFNIKQKYFDNIQATHNTNKREDEDEKVFHSVAVNAS